MKFAHFSQLFNKPDLTGHARYEQMWRELELADRVGFNYGFQSVHHFFKLRPTPAVFCTGGAARTRNLRLGPMGYIAGLHDPIEIIEETAVLDNVTNGRLEIGLVFGVYPDYFRVYNADGDNRRELAKETVLALKAFYRRKQDELFNFTGPFHQYENVEFAIAPVQKPGPPIWLSSTQLETLRFLAREGVHGGYLHLHDRSEMAPRIRQFLQWWDESEHQEKPNIGYLCFVYVDETDEIALQKAIPWIAQSSELIYGQSPRMGGTYSEVEEKLGPRSEEILRNKLNAEFLLEQNLVFVGSPETVARRIRSAAEEGLFNTVLAEFNIGAIGDEDLMRSIRLFGERVIPALQSFDPTQ